MLKKNIKMNKNKLSCHILKAPFRGAIYLRETNYFLPDYWSFDKCYKNKLSIEYSLPPMGPKPLGPVILFALLYKC